MASGIIVKSRSKEGSGTGSGAAAGAPLEKQFELFARFGETANEGKGITLSNSDKWMKQAGVIPSMVTTTDTSIEYKKIAKTNKYMNFGDYQRFLEALAKYKKIDVADIKKKLTQSGPPKTAGTTKISSAGGVDRMTDPSLYTGAHKERFDVATGKGKGKAGRADVSENTGFVSGFNKNKK